MSPRLAPGRCPSAIHPARESRWGRIRTIWHAIHLRPGRGPTALSSGRRRRRCRRLFPARPRRRASRVRRSDRFAAAWSGARSHGRRRNPGYPGLDLQQRRARSGAAPAPRDAVPSHGREPVGREHHGALAWHPPAERDGRRPRASPSSRSRPADTSTTPSPRPTPAPSGTTRTTIAWCRWAGAWPAR